MSGNLLCVLVYIYIYKQDLYKRNLSLNHLKGLKSAHAKKVWKLI